MKRLIFLLFAALLTSISFSQGVTIKDSSNDTLITINDEGISKSSITIQNSGSAPGNSTDKLYNVGHSLFWNGSMLGTGGSPVWSLNVNKAYYNTGYVGIGTQDPLVKLHVVGDFQLEDASPYVNFYSGTTQMGNIGFWTDNNLNIINRGATSPIVFATNAAEKMRITADGNVGIGTATPSEKLHVDFGNILIRGDTEGQMSLKIVDDDTGKNYEIGATSNEVLSFKADGTERMSIAASGKVGIGTMKLTGAFEDKDGDAGSAGQILSSTVSGTDWIPVDSSLWAESGSDIYRSLGNVGIGTLTPVTDLHVDGFDGLLVQGSPLNENGTIQNLGGGRRMHFYPKKAAFRVGTVDGSYWNDTNIGFASVAMGWDTKASGGGGSFAMGIGTIASGNSSFAVGNSTKASGVTGVAMGLSTKASGNYSTALGFGIEASGLYSFGIGLNDQIGTNITQDNTMAIMGGKVGIDEVAPQATLDVGGDVILGADGARFIDIREVTGTTWTTGGTTYYNSSAGLPSGWPEGTNKYVLSLQIYDGSRWWLVGSEAIGATISFAFNETGLWIYHPNEPEFQGKPWKMIVMIMP